MATHNLKIDAVPFSDLLSGVKTAEVRNDDRGFEVGDTVYLTCSDGRTAERNISHIQHGYGLPDGICVLSYTRAAPDVPELVRYEYDILLGKMDKYNEGEYVRYDQAAAMLAAKGAAYERMKVESSKHAHDAETVRRERDALIAELAQIKAQLKDKDAVHIAMLRGDIAKPDATQIKHIYASPVASEDLKEKVEVLREALTGIASFTQSTGLLWWQVRAREALAATEVKP